MRSLLALLFSIPLLLAAPDLADAAGKNKGKAGPVPTASTGKADKGTADKGKASKGTKGKSDAAAIDKVIGSIISATERALIGDYVKKAKAKHNGLPPGLAKRALPSDLRGLLPRRIGQDFRVVGDDIVLIETATNIILDVMKGVLR